MSEKKIINNGYQPSNKGYQPSQPAPQHEPRPQSGYQPTNTGTNPANKPTPPKSE